jgi:hypothetical protein
MTMLTLPACRTDAAAFLKQSGYYTKGARWQHCPLLVFIEAPEGVELRIVDTAAQLRDSPLPDETRCMQQWRGEWRSDWFGFTLGEARAALAPR